MIIEFADIRNVICIDKSALDRLPRAMLERAEWAREALMYPDEHIIEFGRYGDNGYVFAVYNEEDELWFDILGHYHHSSPSEVILGREDRASGRRKIDTIARKLKAEVESDLGVELPRTEHPLAVPTFGLDVEYRKERCLYPKICASCGETETSKKFHWHHLDVSILRKTGAAQSVLRQIDVIKEPILWQAAYRYLLEAHIEYWGVPVEETLLLCPSCHHKKHAGPRRTREEKQDEISAIKQEIVTGVQNARKQQ